MNDRTVYNSPEDAIKAFSEAQERIVTLSQWEKEMKESYGLTSPQEVKAYLDQLYELQQKSAQQAATPPPASSAGGATDKTTVDRAAAGDRVAYESLTPEWKAHVDYLNKMGYVTEDRLKPIEQKFAQIDQREQAAYAQRVDAAKTAGVTILTGMLKDAGLPQDEATVGKMGEQIGEAIYAASRDAQGKMIFGSPEYRFIYGTDADRTAILKDQLTFYTGLAESFATTKSAGYVAAKTAAQAGQPTTLPASSSPTSTVRTGRLTEEQRKLALAEALGSAGMR